MHIDAMAGIRRTTPSGDDAPPTAPKKGRGQQQSSAGSPGKGGAKGETMQKSADKNQEPTSANSANDAMAIELTPTAGLTRESTAAGKKPATAEDLSGAKGMPRQKNRCGQQYSSDSEEHAPLEMEVEQTAAAVRTASPTATDVFSRAKLSDTQPGDTSAALAPVPEHWSEY
eukprot:1183728-Prymnesium_polylepis.1